METTTSFVMVKESREVEDEKTADVARLANVFKALGVPGRVRMLHMISDAGELCVQDITEVIGLSQSSVSHHLKVLADAGIVQRSQRGTWAFYRVAENFTTDLLHYIKNLSSS